MSPYHLTRMEGRRPTGQGGAGGARPIAAVVRSPGHARNASASRGNRRRLAREIGQRLAAARAKAGRSQSEAATRLGLAQSAIAKLEQDRRQLALLEALDLPAYYDSSSAIRSPSRRRWKDPGDRLGREPIAARSEITRRNRAAAGPTARTCVCDKEAAALQLVLSDKLRRTPCSGAMARRLGRRGLVVGRGARPPAMIDGVLGCRAGGGVKSSPRRSPRLHTKIHTLSCRKSGGT